MCNIVTEFYLYSIVYIYLIKSRLDVTFSVRHHFCIKLYHRSTTHEEKARFEDPCYERYVILSFVLPFYIICTVLYAPIAATCFLIWIALQSGQPSHKFINQSDSQDNTLKWSNERIFHITSINTYLMPEFSARYYNLGDTQERARKIVSAFGPRQREETRRN